MRLIPAATDDSRTILKIPICPVACTWIPPQSSTDSPNLITLTESPYFSPNRAMAPIPRASCMGTERCSSTGVFWRIIRFTFRSTSLSSSSVTFEKWLKSNRK